MTWKSKYLEAENARLRADNRLLLAALLNQAGQRTAAEMVRDYKPAVIAGPEGVQLPPSPDTPVSRGWRSVRSWWQEQLSEPEEDSNAT